MNVSKFIGMHVGAIKGLSKTSKCCRLKSGRVWQALDQIPTLPNGGCLRMWRASALVLWVPTNDFHAFWIVMSSTWFTTIPLVISRTIEHGHFTIALNLRISEAFNRLSFGWKFIKSKYHTPKNYTNVVTILNWTPTFQWYMARFAFKMRLDYMLRAY